MRRYKMSRRGSRRSFKAGDRVHKKNLGQSSQAKYVMRGGVRL